MSRITRTSALGIALALVGTIHAQTSARNPQRPKTKVEEARSDKEVQRIQSGPSSPTFSLTVLPCAPVRNSPSVLAST